MLMLGHRLSWILIERPTEEAYRHGVRQFILFSDKSHPREIGAAEVERFLNHLAVERRVAASTRSHVLNAIVFRYDSNRFVERRSAFKPSR